MNQRTWLNKFLEERLPCILLIIISFLFIKKDYNIRFHDETTIDNLKDTTWAIQEFSWNIYTWTDTITWDKINTSWVIIEIPSNPRDLLDYQIEYGEWWIDYIVATPIWQPNINSKTSKENNEKMHNYLYNNRITFDIKDTSRQWYIMFVTSKPIKSISNIFIWLDWSTIWWLDKDSTNRTKTKKENEFIYPLNNLDLIWNNNYHFHPSLTWKKTISINAVVWEDNNKIEKIIIFFR